MKFFITCPIPSGQHGSLRKPRSFTCCSRPPEPPSNPSEQEHSDSNEPPWKLLQSRISGLREKAVARNRTVTHNWWFGRYKTSVVAAIKADFVRKLAFHGDWVAFGTSSGSVVFSNLVTGVRFSSLMVHDGQVSAIDYRDGYIVSAGIRDKDICVWKCLQYENRSWPNHFVDNLERERQLPAPFIRISGHNDIVSGVRIDDGKVYSACVDGTVRVACLETGKILQKIHVGDPIFSMVLTEKRYLLLGCASGKVQAFQAEKGLYLLSITCHPANTTALDFSEESQMLVTGDSSGHVDLWSFKNCSHIASLQPHQGAVMCIQMDGSKVISAGRDGCIIVRPISESLSYYSICGFTRYISSVVFDETRLLADGTNDVIVCHQFDKDEDEP